jgi:hypothetical protein
MHAFVTDRARPDGLTYWCRDCRNAYSRSRYVPKGPPRDRQRMILYCGQCNAVILGDQVDHGKRRKFCSRSCAQAWLTAPLTERIWRRVDRTGAGCWEWPGGRDGYGYGIMVAGRRLSKAHRVAWESVNGPIPRGAHILHHCDNPPCVRPDHLYAGSHADNMRDMAQRARAVATGARLREDQVRLARRLVTAGASQTHVARLLGVTQGAISRLCHGRAWRRVGT